MLGARIKALREQLGITSQELAERANVSQPYISQIENDRRQPSYNTLYAIANALNTSIDYFLSRNNESSANPSHSCDLEYSMVYNQKTSSLLARESINLTALVDYAFAIENAVRAEIGPDELNEAVEALKKLKRLRR